MICRICSDRVHLTLQRRETHSLVDRDLHQPTQIIRSIYVELHTHLKQGRKELTWLGIRISCVAIVGNRSRFLLKSRRSSMNADIRHLSAANSAVKPRNKNSQAEDTSTVNHEVHP